MTERKLIKAVIAGEAELDELLSTMMKMMKKSTMMRSTKKSLMLQKLQMKMTMCSLTSYEIIDSFLGELPPDEVISIHSI